MNIESDFYKKLDIEKIKINWNKNPIVMDLFLSFLNVEVEVSTDHLGYIMGWTKRENKDLYLIIGGGIVGGEEYLDSIQYKNKLSNPYNNYVNPFYIFEILNDEGKSFFVNYYAEDIMIILRKQHEKIDFLEKSIKKEKQIIESFNKEVLELYSFRK